MDTPYTTLIHYVVTKKHYTGAQHHKKVLRHTGIRLAFCFTSTWAAVRGVTTLVGIVSGFATRNCITNILSPSALGTLSRNLRSGHGALLGTGRIPYDISRT